MSNEKKLSFINFGGIDYWYHNRAHAEVQIMTRIAQSNKVLFINSIGMRTPRKSNSPAPGKRIIRKIKSTIKFLRKPDPELPNFYVFSPIIIPLYDSAFFRTVNARMIAIQTRAVSRFIGMSKPVISVTVPTAAPAIKHIPHAKLVLHRFDKMSAFKGANQKLIETYEKELLSSADLVLFSSTQLMDEESNLCRGEVQFFDHGVNLELFKRQNKIPEDISDIKKPIIGFFGGLDDHVVDFELLENIAIDISDTSLVLVGDAPRPINDLLKYPNVHWLGKKDPDEIPAYGSQFDVGIMPFHQSQWLKYANPIKLKEYLALGLPIISTPIPESTKYRENVFIANTYPEMVARIREILSHKEQYASDVFRALQRAKVDNSDWNDRATEYISLVGKL